MSDYRECTTVSVIMPSLNVADYIEASLKSVHQIQNLDGVEILCIDAGSTDGTLEIIRRFASVDNRIRLILSDKKSYGYQVNLGIRAARGKYIDIVETDDCVTPDVLKVLYDASEQNDLDVCKCNYYTSERIGENTIFIPSNPLKDAGYGVMYGKVICASDYPELLIRDWPIWDGILRRQFVIDNNIYCNESPGAAYQDLGFSVELYAALGKTMYLDEYYYRYTIDRAESSIRQNKSMMQEMGEYKRLFDKKVIPENKFAGIRRTVDWKMLNTFAAKSDMILPMVNYDVESELFRQPYIWFKNMIEMEFHGDYSDNICGINPENIEKVTDLIASPSMYANKLYVNNERIRQEERIFLQKILSAKKHVIIFGCGIKGQRLFRWLLFTDHSEKEKINIDAATDNDKKRWNSSFMGVDVVPPEEAVRNYYNDIFIIANKFHSDDIKRQLLNLGMDNESILIFKL